MTDSNQRRKKKKITYTASPQGVEKAKNAFKRLELEQQKNFEKSIFLSRFIVMGFFTNQGIQFDSVKRICEALKLDLEEILFTKAVIILEGKLDLIYHNFSVLYPTFWSIFFGDAITITDIQEGSIRLIIEGLLEDIEQLIFRFNSGELTEISGFPVMDIQILSKSSDDNEINKLNDKWRLVQEIVSQVVDARNLSGADLSDADLNSTYLNNADLSDADLSDADLTGANLTGAQLNHANLTGAQLNHANLIGANLIDADLSDANLNRVNLINAKLNCAGMHRTNLSEANLKFASLSDANLINADLRHADLRHADLMGADLSSAVLMDADLSDANLSGASLIGADLSDANLSGANLSGANLNFARLIDVNLIGAVVKKAQFGDNLGLTEEMELNLKQRGAIFKDSSGNRSKVLSRR
jgi:uncharacterized protein YjbI with pentapeptide repeats